jgi:hypothetical protein
MGDGRELGGVKTMSGLFGGGGGGDKKPKKEGYIGPAGQVPTGEPDTSFPAPGAVPAKPAPLIGGIDAAGSSTLAQGAGSGFGSYYG